ncbi:ATP-binding protein [Cupriavidus sp. TKC]|uniref:ATP-binding protein n=1 Tax=Cupriavidus sp. TKC TaxID=2880159 RepID=UPI00295E7DE3|nr:ATP-binding protein [Cupriavidus sp. TKC]
MLSQVAAYSATLFALFAAAAIGVASYYWRVARPAQAETSALKAECSLLQSLLDSSPNPVLVVNHEHCVVKANSSYVNLSGISIGDLVGRPLAHGHSIGRFRDLGAQLELTLLRMEGKEQSDVITLKVPDQPARTFKVDAKKCSSQDGLFSGIAILMTDIGEQVEAQDRMVQTSAAMDDITDALVVTFFQLCRESNGHLWIPWIKGMENAGWEWTAERMMRDGGGILPNLSDSDRKRFIEALEHSFANQTPVDITLWVAPYDRWVHLVTGKPRSGADGATQWYGYAMDVTEEQRYNALLATARREAEAATEAKSRFLAAMSHEIRTPLATVIASLELLREDELSARQLQELDLASHSAQLLLEVLGDVLDFSRIEAGEMKLEQAPLDLRLTIEDVLRIQARQISEKGVGLEFYVAAGVAATFLGDAVRLRQVVLNLVGNAAKFTHQGDIVVRVALIADHSETQTFQIEVSDTGIGIPEEKQNGLFRAFVQADRSTARRFGGSGLGLAICSRLVQAMGGTIALSSTPGVGSTFRVELTLPVVERCVGSAELAGKRIAVDVSREGDAGVIREYAVALGMRPTSIADDMPPHVAVIESDTVTDGLPAAVPTILYGNGQGGLSGPPIWWSEFRSVCLEVICRDIPQPSVQALGVATQLRQSGSLAGLTILPILVAEDHGPFQIVIRRQIEVLGLACDVVSDGKEALAALQERRYSMILTDCHMPYMDGYELTSAIRASEIEQGQRLPVIALSADASDDQMQRGRAAGMDDFLLKPLKLPELRTCIERWALR